MGTLANNEDPDENAAFHQGLHNLLRQNNIQRKKFNFIWKLKPVAPQIIKCTLLSLLYQTRKKTPLVYIKG